MQRGRRVERARAERLERDADGNSGFRSDESARRRLDGNADRYTRG
jgi:hypothetical protein